MTIYDANTTKYCYGGKCSEAQHLICFMLKDFASFLVSYVDLNLLNIAVLNSKHLQCTVQLRTSLGGERGVPYC